MHVAVTTGFHDEFHAYFRDTRAKPDRLTAPQKPREFELIRSSQGGWMAGDGPMPWCSEFSVSSLMTWAKTVNWHVGALECRIHQILSH